MLKNLNQRFCLWAGLTGPMQSHRRTTVAERSAIQMNVFSSRMTDMGKMLVGAGVLGLIASAWVEGQPNLLGAVATLLGGTFMFGIGIFTTGLYVEVKSETPKLAYVNVGKKRRRGKRR